MPTREAFHCEVKESQDGTGWKTTTVSCHGRLISEDTPKIREVVGPIIAAGGRVILDFSDLDYLDSSGLGAIVALKVTSIHRGLCRLDLVNLTPRIRQLLSMTRLLTLFAEEVPTDLL
jgi:anti-anti-sigma factor